MNLSEAPVNKKLKIESIESGIDIRRKLTSVGIHYGDFVLKLNHAKWGPVLLCNLSSGSAKLALGRGLADQILVGYEA
jgi:Fe2+ transport system protein FeoA